MSDEYGTNPYLLHRRGSPDTSINAAHAVDTTALEAKVHNAIISSEDHGLIADDILDMFPYLPYSSVTARFSALENKNHIFRHKGDTRTGRSGRQQMVMRDISYKKESKMANIAPWSFSKIKSFEQCPKQFYHEKVLKEYPFVPTQATIYGNAFHKAAELYIKDNEPLPDEFQFAQNFLDTLAAKRGVKFCERKMGVKENLEACDFYDKRAWFRGIADLLIIDVLGEIAWVIDYKTSKSSRYADKGQLELMALTVFAHFPEIKKVRAGLVFVLVNDLVKHTYEEQDKADLWEKWIAKHNGLRAAAESDTWNARPNGLCKRHCPVVECIHNGANA